MDLLQTVNQSLSPGTYNAPRLVLVTAPTVEPVTLTEAKNRLRVDTPDDDALLTELITAARRIFEELTGRALVNTTWRAEWDHLPRAGTYALAPGSRVLELPRAPLVSVTHIKYSADDAAGTETTFAVSNYTVETGLDANRFGRLWLKAGAAWPALGSFPGALRCEFVAGYGSAAVNVPAEIKAALHLLIAHFYEQRIPVNIGNVVNEIPFTLRTLIDLHTLRSLA